jgi:hypothetical protein
MDEVDRRQGRRDVIGADEAGCVELLGIAFSTVLMKCTIATAAD